VIRSIASLLLVLGCGGDCIPKDIKNADAFAVNSVPSSDVRVIGSANELRATIDTAHVSFPQATGQVYRAAPLEDPAVHEANARKGLDEFVAATNFATTAIALVHAGGARASLRGLVTRGPTTTLYFTGVCSTCGGGDPGSYYTNAAAEDAARAERTELVRVPKGSRVVFEQCSIECGPCPSNVP
jgi:hypothetical protein